MKKHTFFNLATSTTEIYSAYQPPTAGTSFHQETLNFAEYLRVGREQQFFAQSRGHAFVPLEIQSQHIRDGFKLK